LAKQMRLDIRRGVVHGNGVLERHTFQFA
jgi:hypothetical protein